MKRRIYVLIILILAFANTCIAKANINIIPGDGVTDEQINSAIIAVKTTAKYMKDNLGLELNENIVLNLAYSSAELPNMYNENDINTNVSGKSYRGKINILLSSDSSDYRTIFLVSHEMIHQYQLNVVDFSTLNKNMWFTEGMADVLAIKIVEDIVPNVEPVFKKNIAIKNNEDSLLLGNITNKKDWVRNFNKNKNTYAKADIAVFYLVDNYSSFLLLEYLNNLYFDTPSNALSKTYGISINELETNINM